MQSLMKLPRVILLVLPLMGLLSAEETAPKEVLKDVKGMKCPVDAKKGCEGGYCSNKVKRDISVEHEGRKVYFCCKGCVDEFQKDPKAFAGQVKAQWKVIDAKKE